MHVNRFLSFYKFTLYMKIFHQCGFSSLIFFCFFFLVHSLSWEASIIYKTFGVWNIGVHKATSGLRGRRQFLHFSLFSIKFFWNLHTICEIELRSNFCYEVLFFFMIIAFFSKKKYFSHSAKKNRSRWVFIVQVWLIYQNVAKTTRRRSSSLFFWS